MLGPDDPLPHRPRRVLLAGTSGAGKTTTAARVAALLGAPHVEIDALFHGPGWVPRPTFVEDVHRFSAAPAWVTEWQYDQVLQHLAERADLLVHLDPPRRVVLRQVVRRTLVRRLRRQELWNGNVEPPLRTFWTDPEHVVRWSWSTHPRTAARVAALRRDRPDLLVVRLRSRAEVRRWLGGPLARAAG
ncbi:AAA family ATPase [Kineococcus terrestris]|uniref:AAA family ATPase n=1 Tax=Kineococcus terrestris TaxID=2044856 RepID=UPI0034DAD9D4